MSEASVGELQAMLGVSLAVGRPHVEMVAIVAAVISEALRQNGMEATLVGGGAIEVHAPEIYSTTDIDLVVEGKSRKDIDATLTELGFTRRGRHWVQGDTFVEIPGNWMSDPVEIIQVGQLALRVVRREVVLADRIIGFKHWRVTAYGAQAIALLGVFGQSLDETWLRNRLRSEDAEDALEALRALAEQKALVDEARLQQVLGQLVSHRTRNVEDSQGDEGE